MVISAPPHRSRMYAPPGYKSRRMRSWRWATRSIFQHIPLVNRGTKEYFWLTLRPRALQLPGDGRINSFGLGGEVEVRAGLLFQKQPIAGPMLHFGLGEHRAANVARIIWPNGDVQAEFELQARQVVVARQRLQGSCPWLFAYDGEAMRSITDFIRA